MDNKLSMLIADDMSINRTLLRNIFSDEYDIYEAENGQEVMDIIRREEIDILLLDICLPVLDGMEVLKELNKDSRFSKIAVIVNTAVNDPIKEIQALGLGADDYIAKPYNPQVIKRRVTNLVSKYVLKRKELTKDLESKSEQLSMLVDMMPGGIGALEQGSPIRCTYYNEGLCRLLGYDAEEFEEQAANHMETVVYEEDIDIFRQFMKTDTRGQKPVHCTLRFVKKNGSILWLGLSARRDTGKHRKSSFYTVFTDLTEEKNDMQKLQAQVEKDLLTGIYNRRAFYKKTKQLIEEHQAEKYVIVQWNIDRFKVINALYGSQCGDEVLIACARQLEAYIGIHGICGRLEADHFVAVITMDYISSTIPSMERILSAGIEMDRVDYPIMMHAGYYEISDPTQSIDVMCDCANLALQEVKKNYLKRWEFFDEGMQQNLMNEQTLVNEMEQALNLRQFIIRIQPIYDASTHEIASGEALVRWQHPQKGLISPGVFIPLFEKNGFIAKLDMFVWEEVCSLLAENERLGRKNVPISVNVSRINFYNPDLFMEIEAIAQKYGIDHSMLKFEITESAYMENPQQLIHEMEKIKELGFSLLMDDFGSGYSSLNTLKDVPVDILKIDMKFLDHLENSPKATSILYSVIKMAQGLEISVVVEGVETKNQYEMLKSMGCEYIQGYYFSRPLSIVEFQKHLENGRIKRNVPKADMKKTILVVDDLKLNRASIAANIAENYQVLEAENGKEALEILKINPMGISLVITDIMMPVMDGFELLENIQNHHLFSRIPVLVLTSLNEGEKEIKAISLGAQDVITRPFDPSLLKLRIYNLLKISENEIIQAEIHSLRENFVIKRQLEDIIHDGVADFCSMKINETSKDYKLDSLEYANEGYFRIHGIEKQDGLRLGSMEGIFENIVAAQQEDVIKCLVDAFQKKSHYIQNIYDIEKDGRVITVVSTGQIRYEKKNMITLALLEVPIWSKENLIQRHLFGNLIFDLFADTQTKIWCFDLQNNRFYYKSQKLDNKGKIDYVSEDEAEEIIAGELMEQDMKRMHFMYQRLREGEASVKEIFKIRTNEKTNDGNPIYHWVCVTYKTIARAAELPVMAIGMAEDVTGEMEIAQLKRQELHYRKILNKGVLLFVDVDICNNTFSIEESAGDSKAEYHIHASFDTALQKYISTYIHPKDAKICYETLNCSRLKEMFDRGIRDYQFELRGRISDRHRYEWYMVSLFFTEYGRDGELSVNLQLRNIQVEYHKMQLLRRQAECDVMTGCYNRATFEKLVEQFCSDNVGNNSAFIMIDADNFKLVNDAFGHDTGDAVLKTLSDQLTKTFRKEDIIGRLGGDEFAVFINNAGSKDAICKKAGEICRRMYLPLENNGRKILISCSVGVSFAKGSRRSFQLMYKQADEALYQAKNFGKNKYRVYENE